MKRNKPIVLGELLKQYKSDINVSNGLLSARVMRAWDVVMEKNVVDATLNKYYNNGILYCTIGSSLLRAVLQSRLPSIVYKLNQQLGGSFVKAVILR